MIPIQYALIGFGLSAMVGAVLMVVFRPKYDAAAEFLELLTAKDLQAVADWFQAKADQLKAPGK